VSFLRLDGTPREVVASVRSWLVAESAPPVLIETSGTTGAPKRVLLSRAAVLASARATERRLAAEGPWLLALPASYVAEHVQLGYAATDFLQYSGPLQVTLRGKTGDAARKAQALAAARAAAPGSRVRDLVFVIEE